MSGSASIDLERALLEHSLAIAPMPTLGRVYVALCQTAPTETAGGIEASGGGYARATATFALMASPSNAASNATTVEFPVATAVWGTIGHFEIWTAATGGTRLYWGPLTDPADGVPIEMDVATGDVVRFSAGALIVQASETAVTVGGPYLPLTGGVVTGLTVFNAATVRVQGVAGTVRRMQLTTNNIARWNIEASNAAEAGNSAGSLFEIGAYNDAGAFTGHLLQGQRTSGGLGRGRPYIASFAPYTQAFPRATVPGAPVGNYQNFLANGDIQPAYTLGANPLSVTSGSPTVTITWTGAGATGGPLSKSPLWEVWVNIVGATAVGGITPTGWLKVQSLPDADHFTVTWTSNATSTATGGGSSITVQPSFGTSVNSLTSTTKFGGYAFVDQTEELWNVDPYFLALSGDPSPRYLQRWHWTCGPVADATKNYSLAGIEWDLTNRGPDMGYAPDAGGAIRNTIGIWMGPALVPTWATGGGTPASWGTVYAVYSQQGVVGSYIGLSVQPNALVGASRDPTGHGGVGTDVFGSYVNLPGAPFATTSGASTITVTISPGALSVQANGDSVWMPNVVTLAGVTFGGASYVIAGVDKVNGKFTITGTGTASSTASGGGSGQWLAFANLVPYSPYQAQGSFKHGLISTKARFESGGIIETQPGNGILWGDGTGTASINSVLKSAGNIDVVVTPAGTGGLKMPLLTNAASDAAAASAGVAVGQFYRNGSVVMQRVV